MDDDDDTQVYKDHGDALTIAYQSGYYDGKKAAQRKPLTDEQIDSLALDHSLPYSTHSFARAIEAAHGIKENT